VVVLAAGGYLLGSVPFGLLVGKARGVDVRLAGSRNIGATNVGRVVGRPWGALVFVLDLLKGLLPTVTTGVVLAAGQDEPGGAARGLFMLLVGLAAVLGHNYPVYLRFRGGKGVTTSLGAALGVYPYLTCAALVALGVWTLVTLVSRYVSLGSICGAIALPIALVLIVLRAEGSLASQWPLVICSVLLAAMVIRRHRGNISRLLNGTETRIGEPKRAG
jgi:glycerol-3-phosphate acyltransferase PlsY